MVNKYLINLGVLNENEVDFHDWCLANYNQLIATPLNKIAKKYGVGVSFIYSFFEKLKLRDLKEFLVYLGYTLGQQDASVDNPDLTNDVLNLTKINDLMVRSNEQTFRLLNQQKEYLNDFVEDIHNYPKIITLGFGYSYLALQDFLGFCQFTGSKQFVMLNDKEPQYLKAWSQLDKKSVVIIYSARACSRKLYSWVRRLRLEQHQIKIWLITTNSNNSINKYVDRTIEIDDISKRVDGYNAKQILSPIQNYIIFNNIVKTIYFEKYASELKGNRLLREEIDSWRDHGLIG
ncbi:DNA-binding MurR/RpiR family transcriptional regulator [Entomoplasma freundtii]|uniref:Uncharacterized protein n=1 Tax=Entomoplasma freundtii TaxID=74700 RepID=A0A2K8NQD7_9MOLU|nr:hypothetical protein [Entomoplasma freundtii]ATZ16055.1 hypothetical protein EFREU_v1c00280 [Entomoplasma freundtii]TDY58076.1 DNA-binding MurR/RpiR family transcriptional regulator [Entomoplasma freundtii]